MTQGRSLTFALVVLDTIVVFLVFNTVAWLRGVTSWHDPLTTALSLPLGKRRVLQGRLGARARQKRLFGFGGVL